MTIRHLHRNYIAFLIAIITLVLLSANFPYQIVFAQKQETLMRKAYRPLNKIVQNRYVLDEDGIYRIKGKKIEGHMGEQKAQKDNIESISNKNRSEDTTIIRSDEKTIKSDDINANNKDIDIKNDDININENIKPNENIKTDEDIKTKEDINKNIEIKENIKEKEDLKSGKEANKETVEESKEQIEQKVTVMLTGDLMCLRAQQYGAKSENTFNFNHSFSYVKQIFSNSDLVIGNLETLTSHSNYYTFEQKIIKNSPNCNAPATFLDALRYAGFDAVVTANNHCLDGGMTGMRETIEKLEEYHIAQVGTYLRNDVSRFLLYEVNGIKIGVLSYTEYINFRNSLSAKDLDSSVNCYSKKAVERDVKEAKKAGAEFIIAYNHWGTENTTEVTKLQQAHAMEMAEAGVDIIIGSHPHCLQEAVYLETSDNRKVLCMYSMGNFVSSMVSEANNETIILRLDLVKEDGKVTLKQTGYYPFKVYPVYEKKRFVVVPTQKVFHNGKTIKTLEQAGKRIKNVLGKTLKEWKIEK